MLRILVVVFFWLCAVALLALSIRAEASDRQRARGGTSDHAKIGADRSAGR
jgi:hypothetical protein